MRFRIAAFFFESRPNWLLLIMEQRLLLKNLIIRQFRFCFFQLFILRFQPLRRGSATGKLLF